MAAVVATALTAALTAVDETEAEEVELELDATGSEVESEAAATPDAEMDAADAEMAAASLISTVGADIVRLIEAKTSIGAMLVNKAYSKAVWHAYKPNPCQAAWKSIVLSALDLTSSPADARVVLDTALALIAAVTTAPRARLACLRTLVVLRERNHLLGPVGEGRFNLIPENPQRAALICRALDDVKVATAFMRQFRGSKLVAKAVADVCMHACGAIDSSLRFSDTRTKCHLVLFSTLRVCPQNVAAWRELHKALPYSPTLTSALVAMGVADVLGHELGVIGVNIGFPAVDDDADVDAGAMHETSALLDFLYGLLTRASISEVRKLLVCIKPVAQLVERLLRVPSAHSCASFGLVVLREFALRVDSLLHQKAVPVALNALKLWKGDEGPHSDTCVFRALTLVHTLCVHNEARVALVNAGGTNVAVDFLMRDTSVCNYLQYVCFDILRRLVGSDEQRALLVDRGAVERVVELMTRFKNNARFARQGINLISSLSASSTMCGYLVHCGAYAAVTSALAAHDATFLAKTRVGDFFTALHQWQVAKTTPSKSNTDIAECL